MFRTISIYLACATLIGCGTESLPITTNISGEMLPPPRPGVASMYRGLMVPVPGARVNASGGNLYVERRDMSVGTRVYDWAVGAVWNSASGEWQWNFDSSLVAPRPGQPPIFTSATGYTAFLKGVDPGEEIPGTRWVSHSATAVRTVGGLIHHFDAAGWLASVNWASAPYPSIEFVRADVGGASRVTRVDQCTSVSTCTPLYTMGFDAQGRISSIADHSGRYALYNYEGDSERVISVKDPLDVQKGWPGMRYEYDARGRLDAKTNSHGERVEYSYCDTSNSVCTVKQIGEGDPVWSFAYSGMKADRHHASTTLTDPLGKSAAFVFDFALRTKSYTNPDGEKWTWSWSDTKLTGVTSPAGGTTRIDLSEDRTVLTESTASGNSVVTTFAPYPAENRAAPFERPVLHIDDQLGSVEARTYTPAGELASIANGEGETTTFITAQNGDWTVTNPAGRSTVYAGRADHGGFSTVTKGGKTVTRTYDATGNMLSVDGLLEEDFSLHGLSVGQGGVVSRSYDADRNVSSVVLEDSTGTSQRTLQIEWRSDHQAVAIDRPHGGDTVRLYDALGRMSEVRNLIDGTWQSTTFEYDLNGRSTASLRPNGMATRWTYRSSGEIASIRHERDWADPLETDGEAQFEYLDGQRIAIRDSAYGMVPEQYFYDSEGRVDEIVFPGGEQIIYGYDARGRKTLEEYRRPDSAVLRIFEYDYDLAGRITAVREDGVQLHGTTFVDGHVDRVDYGNGVEVVHGYDPVTGTFAGFTATDTAQQVIAQMTVSRTNCGIQLPASRCVTEQTQTYSGVASTSYAEYQLDDLGTERLIADSYGAVIPFDGHYEYDELSNLVQSPEGDFVYNAERNRLLQVEQAGSMVVDYAYDAAGFVTSRDGLSIVWNGMGRVESVGNDLSVQWDALARKVSKTESSQETHWKYGGALTEDDFGTDQKIDMGWVVCNLDDDSHDYRLFDFRGNAKLTLDDIGEVTSHQHYSGYDRVAVDGAGPDGTGFAGGAHAGDLVVLGARIYDPVTGRFLSEDPIPQIVNQYAYTLGNPVRFWDPNGMQSSPTPTNSSAGSQVTMSHTGAGGGSAKFKVDILKRFFGSASFEISWTTGPSTTISIKPIPEGGGSAQAGSTEQKLSTPATGPNFEGANSGTDGGGGMCHGYRSESWAAREQRGWSGKRTPTFSGDTICGLGFEICPIVLLWHAVRQRRRHQHA